MYIHIINDIKLNRAYSSLMCGLPRQSTHDSSVNYIKESCSYHEDNLYDFSELQTTHRNKSFGYIALANVHVLYDGERYDPKNGDSHLISLIFNFHSGDNINDVISDLITNNIDFSKIQSAEFDW